MSWQIIKSEAVPHIRVAKAMTGFACADLLLKILLSCCVGLHAFIGEYYSLDALSKLFAIGLTCPCRIIQLEVIADFQRQHSIP